MNIDEFAERLRQEVFAASQVTGGSPLESFTEMVADRLEAAGEIDSSTVAYHYKTGIELSGWSYDSDNNLLHLFVTLWNPTEDLPSLTTTDATSSLRRVANFVNRCVKGYASSLEESDPVWEVADLIGRSGGDIRALRIYLFSNHVARRLKLPPLDDELSGVPVDYQIWDLERLYRFDTSGLEREPITVDISRFIGQPLECVSSATEEAQVFLAILPGQFLADLYAEHGARLLERNVRSFLQARGAVNRGIRDSLIHEPERFLAYNNGISATASDISVVDLPQGGSAISEIKDLQIVNGGQTTASLYHAVARDRTDLSQVSVQAKITVVGPELIDQIVPLISRYSNTQNKVTGADFSANDPFHIRVEGLSRTVWAPSADGTPKLTLWFYERARGQYADELARVGTTARQKQFKLNAPPNQKFTKTDLAKFMNTWDQRPYMVSLGAEKNFIDFMARVEEHRTDLTVEWFQRLIAKAILYRSAEKIVRQQKFGGYYAQVVAYTLSKLYHATAQRIDLDHIWRTQRLSDATAEAIAAFSHPIHKIITEPSGRVRHIGEWCKKLECWSVVEELDCEVPPALQKELIPLGRKAALTRVVEEDGPTELQRAALGVIEGMAAESWFALSNWAKETSNFTPRERSFFYNLGRLASQGRSPSPKQATWAEQLLLEADRLGFPG